MPEPLSFEYPEPVPPVSQLCALPFVASVAGYLGSTLGVPDTRVTLHRSMTRDGRGYLQQLCAYPGRELDHRTAGRIFAVTSGIVGKAFSTCRIVRTRSYGSEDEWRTDYDADRAALGEVGRPPTGALSYLAVPFLHPRGDAAVSVLYAEAGELNVFAEGKAFGVVLGMCEGFRDLMDGLSRSPLPRVRNYPLPPGRPFEAEDTAYERLQEVLDDPKPPVFQHLTSFNLAPSP